MTLRPNMTVFLDGIRPVAPLVACEWPGVLANLWKAEIAPGGHGRYMSQLPRIVVVLDDTPARMHLSTGPSDRAEDVRLAYIPAELSVSTRFSGAGPLRHLDLYFDPLTLGTKLSDAGRTGAMDRLIRLQEDAAARSIASLLAAEVAGGTRDVLTLDSLAFALVGKMFDGTEVSPSRPGGLTTRQLSALDRFLEAELGRSIKVAEMAEVVGLSESWFAHVYRLTRGETPHRTLQRLRAKSAMALLAHRDLPLAQIAGMLGFADQAHFSRAFRSATGQAPGAWRKSTFQQDSTKPDCFCQD
ncbi:AraC family transcriptional regulator [Salipiger sp. IMCC34102]|uniref:helix-turn-helix domain-containing protein n=1 Tax=Salipiger sp. IMCC34102 TaxID=2510647 RepID=UPI00101DC0BB|nr:AraC family transcriptional regulator [Salipiger sp. IMCC34102]RYH02527.1 AraC family transcriptional regulator [Salipiger sp. IMCC34102]